MTREALAARTLTGYLWGSRGPLWRGLGLALLRSLAVAPCPWLFQRMIDVAVPARDSTAILELGAVFLLLLAVHYVFSVWGANEIAKAMARMMVELRSRLFFKLQFLSFGTFWYVRTQVIALVVMAGGALLALNDTISYGTLFAFVAGLPIVLGPIQAFVGLSEQYFIGRESYRSIKELLDSAYVEDCRTACCFPVPSATTSVSRAPMPPTGKSAGPCSRPTRRSSSPSCPRASTPLLANAASPSPAASGSASPSPAPFCATRPSSSSTKPPRPSTTKANA